MYNRTVAAKAEMNVDQWVSTNLRLLRGQSQLSRTKNAIDTLIDEGGDSFYNYVDWRGLIKDPDLIALSSVHHYFFDNNDLRNINTVINLKQLNLIKKVDVFFKTIFKVIPPGCNFIGCFLDNKAHYHYTKNNVVAQYNAKNNVDPFENGIKSRIPFLNTVYNLLDSRTNKNLTGRNVSFLLKEWGFKVLDMTEMRGLTYFHAQKSVKYRN